MYIGWGQKQDPYGLYSILMDEIKFDYFTKDSTKEYQELTNIQKIENEKRNIGKNKKKNIFPRQLNRTAYRGGEKVIADYTYE